VNLQRAETKGDCKKQAPRPPNLPRAQSGFGHLSDDAELFVVREVHGCDRPRAAHVDLAIGRHADAAAQVHIRFVHEDGPITTTAP
jgi:hypothetical protein